MAQYWRRFAGRCRQCPVAGAVLLLVLAAITGAAPAHAQVAHFYSSLRGMHVAGYQGWFRCPGDGAGISWGHWMRGKTNASDPNTLAVDMWPDTSELDPDELCPTGFRLPGGAPAYLFSNQNPKTVARHFKWMRQYGLDGVAMQRFTAAVARPAATAHLDTVLRNVSAAAEENRRGFFVMYDISGMNGATALDLIKRDWQHLVVDLRVTESPAYIYDRGRPVVGVWGLGFKQRDVSPEQASAIIRYFKAGPGAATVLGGVPASWRNLSADGRWPDAHSDAGWHAVYRSLDVISPWSVGRLRDDRGTDDFARMRIGPDIAETRRLGIEYMPVVFPGFSWHNASLASARFAPIDAIPRRCGAFYRRQVANIIKAGATMLYTAMFDEVNEGTAIFKVAPTPARQPAGADLLPLDAGGCGNATSDLYLRLAGDATRALGQRR